jgi:hypothetical protein
MGLEPDKICVHCQGGITQMRQLPFTRVWICDICSGSEWYLSKQTVSEEGITKQEEEL